MAHFKLSVRVVCMSLALGFSGPAWPQQAETPRETSKNKRNARLHEIYLRDASEYQFFLDDPKREELEAATRADHALDQRCRLQRRGLCLDSSGSGGGRGVHLLRTSRQGCASGHARVPFALSDSIRSGGRAGSGWHPQEPGIRLEPIPDAPEPAGNPPRRLTQMRDLARRFTAQVQRENSKWEMRLLTQPLYRYEISADDSPIVDGGIFTFVWTAGTDPEVLVVIEARRTDKGVRWFYAPARFTNCEAWLQYQGNDVWRAESRHRRHLRWRDHEALRSVSGQDDPQPGRGVMIARSIHVMRRRFTGSVDERSSCRTPRGRSRPFRGCSSGKRSPRAPGR